MAGESSLRPQATSEEAVAVEALADPRFPESRHAVYESRAHGWARLRDNIKLQRLG